jgi:hypothetical protein
MTALPPGIGQAFHMTAAELGMCSAARLFARELAEAGGDDLLAEARDRLGREYPVFDFVAQRALDGEAEMPIDPAPVKDALQGIARLLVVGLEAFYLDALVEAWGDVEVGLIADGAGAELDLRRVLANYGGRVEGVSLADIHRWAGRRSALLTYVYGADAHVAYVNASWLRVSGPDVRTSFRSVVGWDIFGRPMLVYPRWLVETARETLSHVVGP